MKYPVNEKLIQYIWQFQLFNKTELLTVASNTLSIIHPGTININQGPDFLNGKIVAQGLPETIVQPALLKQVFDIETSIMQHPQTGKPIIIF